MVVWPSALESIGPHIHQLENSSQEFDFSINGRKDWGEPCPLCKVLGGGVLVQVDKDPAP